MRQQFSSTNVLDDAKPAEFKQVDIGAGEAEESGPFAGMSEEEREEEMAAVEAAMERVNAEFGRSSRSDSRSLMAQMGDFCSC